jgi:hypothetical protein
VTVVFLGLLSGPSTEPTLGDRVQNGFAIGAAAGVSAFGLASSTNPARKVRARAEFRPRHFEIAAHEYALI